MAESGAVGGAPSGGVTAEVLVAAACFAATAGLAAMSAVPGQDPPAMALLAGWPAFALAGGVVLDQRPAAGPGRVLTLLALVAALDVAWAMARYGGLPTSPDLTRAVAELAAVQVVAVAVALPWAFRRPRGRPVAVACAVVAATGALAVLSAETGLARPLARLVGWALVVAGCAGVWTRVALGARTDERTARRRTAWLLVSLALAGAAVATAWLLSSTDVGYYVTVSVLALTAFAVARLWLSDAFRPLDEHLLDLALVVAAIGAAGLAGLLVRLGAGFMRLPSADTSALFTSLTAVAMAAPAALWARRAVLARRYGSGLIAPSDVAVITADLHAQTEPRDLLDKAARMVAAASGSIEARIVLGADAPAVPERWVLHPLDVGGDRVGALLVKYRNLEGPEPRQRHVVAQLLPTVALVARAVGLAVEAEHARRDVARERDAERKRVMAICTTGSVPSSPA